MLAGTPALAAADAASTPQFGCQNPLPLPLLLLLLLKMLPLLL
jgi:hypothetical protein